MTVVEDILKQRQEEYEELKKIDDQIPSGNGEDGGGEEYRTILEIWSKVLKPAKDELGRRILPQWAIRIVSTYNGVDFKDMTPFRDLFYNRILDLADILDEMIAEDDECLKRISAEEDAQLNGLLYKAVITEWQKQFLLWELAWDCESDSAAIDLATLAEVQKMFFAPEGLVNLLDQISFEFGEADQEELVAALQEVKDAADGD